MADEEFQYYSASSSEDFITNDPNTFDRLTSPDARAKRLEALRKKIEEQKERDRIAEENTTSNIGGSSIEITEEDLKQVEYNKYLENISRKSRDKKQSGIDPRILEAYPELDPNKPGDYIKLKRKTLPLDLALNSPDVVGVVTTTADNTNAVTASENESTVGEVLTVVDPPVTGVTTSTDNASVGLTTGITPKPSPPKYPEGQTQEELKKMVEDEVESQIERLKNYYRRGFPTFEITGGNDIPKHDLSEYQLDTESGQGILFTNTGNAKVLGNASLELISNGKKSGGGGFDKDGEAGVVIYAKDGVIHIESVRGTVNIRARKHIQLEAGEDINFIATRDITMEAGRDMISDIGVDCTEFVGGSKLIDSGGTMSLHSEKQDIETSCGTDPYVCDFHEDIKTEWDKIDALNE